MGSNQKPFYRIVVADSQRATTGRFIENIGYYNPTIDPFEFELDKERLEHWIENGAQISNTVKTLMRKIEKTGTVSQTS
jgi:small subunit ribosomal protein S16